MIYLPECEKNNVSSIEAALVKYASFSVCPTTCIMSFPSCSLSFQLCFLSILFPLQFRFVLFLFRFRSVSVAFPFHYAPFPFCFPAVSVIFPFPFRISTYRFHSVRSVLVLFSFHPVLFPICSLSASVSPSFCFRSVSVQFALTLCSVSVSVHFVSFASLRITQKLHSDYLSGLEFTAIDVAG